MPRTVRRLLARLAPLAVLAAPAAAAAQGAQTYDYAGCLTMPAFGTTPIACGTGTARVTQDPGAPTLLDAGVQIELFGRAAIGPYAGADEFRGDLAITGTTSPLFLLNPGVYRFSFGDRHFGPDLGPGWSPDWLGISILLPDPNDPTSIIGGPQQGSLMLARVAGASIVPEPSTWVLLGTGLLAVGGVARRRRRSA